MIIESPTFKTEEFLVAFGLYALLLQNNQLSIRRSCSGVVLQVPNYDLTNEAWATFVWEELRQSNKEFTAEISKRIVRTTSCGRAESELRAAEERLQKWMEYFEGPEFKSDFDEQYIVWGILMLSKFSFLKVPEMISVFMGIRMGTSVANDLLIRAGSAASWFASDLLSIVQSPEEGNWLPTKALGTVGRNNPKVARALLEMIRSEDLSVQGRGLAVLAVMGSELGDCHDEILKRVLELQTSEDIGFNIRALASIGRNHPEIRATILEMAKPHPPRIVTVETPGLRNSSWSYDAAMYDRGVAIDAIDYFVDYPDEAVPVLIEALDSFEEFDPDYMYNGICERISGVLEAFGPSASSAAVRLAEKFRDADHQEGHPKRLLQALAAMGPSAAAALPTLESVYQEEGGDGEEELFPYPDEFTDPLGWAIYKIKGGV